MATIYQTMKLQTLTQKWEERKQNNLMRPEKDDRTPEQKQMDSMMEMLKRERDSNQKSNQLNQITSKIKSGGELTPEEIEYLRQNAPEQLKDYEEVKAEKKAYEEKLKACKTKEDVARVKMTTLGTFMAEAKSIDNNPYIPKGAKKELMEKLAAKVSNVEQAHLKFIKSKAYIDMPTEEELREEAEEKKEAITGEYEKLAPDEENEAPDEAEDISDKSFSEDGEDTVTQTVSTGDTSKQVSLDGETGQIKAASRTETDIQTKDTDFQKVESEINEFFKRNDDGKRHFTVKV